MLWLGVLAMIPSFGLVLGIVGVSVLAGVWVCSEAEKILGLRDPGCIVLDEILAVPVAGFGWMGWHRLRDGDAAVWLGEGFGGLIWTLAVFVLFRFFDIVKPWPVGASQRLPGGWGVMADDLFAAAYAGLLIFLGAWLLGV